MASPSVAFGWGPCAAPSRCRLLDTEQRTPSRDGLGIHMRTQPDGLYALECGDLLNVLLQLPPGPPAAAHLEIEADASAIELS